MLKFFVVVVVAPKEKKNCLIQSILSVRTSLNDDMKRSFAAIHDHAIPSVQFLNHFFF